MRPTSPVRSHPWSSVCAVSSGRCQYPLISCGPRARISPGSPVAVGESSGSITRSSGRDGRLGPPTAAAQVASRARAGGPTARGTSAPARPRSCRRTAQSRSRTRRSPAAACLRRSARPRSRSSAGRRSSRSVTSSTATRQAWSMAGTSVATRDPLLLEHGHDLFGLERVEHDDRAAATEHREDGRDDRRVEHRQHDQPAISGGDGMRQADLDDVRRSPRHGSARRPWARPSCRSCTSGTARRRRSPRPPGASWVHPTSSARARPNHARHRPLRRDDRSSSARHGSHRRRRRIPLRRSAPTARHR